MARIQKYKIDENVSGKDKVIGTDLETGKATRNYTIESLGHYLSVTEQMKFKYVQTPLSGLGTFSPSTGGTNFKPFSQITNFVIAKEDEAGQDVVPFITYLVGSEILVIKQDDISQFGHYSVISYALNTSTPSNTSYYDLVLGYIGGNGSLELDELYNFANFVKAGDVGDKTFIFEQITPSATWNITHTLNKFPSVSVVDTAGTQVFTDVNYIDKNNITLAFSTGFAGKAFLN